MPPEAPEQAAQQPPPIDEVKQYISARFIGSADVAWRLLGFSMHKEMPNIYRLMLHLEGMQIVCFGPQTDLAAAVANPPVTMPMAFFALNAINAVLGNRETCNTLYPDIPGTHTFDQGQKV